MASASDSDESVIGKKAARQSKRLRTGIEVMQEVFATVLACDVETLHPVAITPVANRPP